MSKKVKIVLGIIIVLLIAALAALGIMYSHMSKIANSDTICDGITIDGVDVSGLSEEDALKKVNEHIAELADTNVTLKASDSSETVKLSDLGFQVASAEATVHEAYEIGKDGSVVDRFKAVKAGVGKGTVYTLGKSISKDKFQAFVDEHAEELVKVAEDATMTRTNGQFVITDGQNGVEVLIDENVQGLDDCLAGDFAGEDFEYELQLDEAEPEYTKEDLEQVKDLLGTYTTTFASSTENRANNIANATSKINDHVVYPGETFGCLDLIKPFTIDNGYAVAHAYSAGEVIDSIGGGVCQMATTLYNAAILSELDIVMRYNHNMIVGYVPLSMDAAISESGGQDLKFTNNTGNPIYIEGYTVGRSVTFNIYGVEYRDSSRSIAFESETLETIQPGEDIKTKDPTLASGDMVVTQEAHTGYRAKLWKIVYENGEEVSRTEFNSSYYAPSARRVSVGTLSSEKDEEEDADDDKDSKSKNKDKSSKDNKSNKSDKSSKSTESKKTTEKKATTEAQTTEAVTEAPVNETTEVQQIVE